MVIDHIKKYDVMRVKGDATSIVILDAIDEVLEKYKNSDKNIFRDKYKAIDLMYIQKTHKSSGVAKCLHVDNATVFRWANDVINEIAVNAKLIRKDAIKTHK